MLRLAVRRQYLRLAEEAAAKGKGLLVAAHNRAWAATSADTVVGSSSFNSSRTVLAARVPDSDSHLPNWPRTYYARLRVEIETSLGKPSSGVYGA